MRTLHAIKLHFIASLQRLYDAQEAQSITHIALEYVLSMGRAELLLNKEKQLTSEQEQQLEGILSRLSAAEPIQYVLGEGDFYGLKFKVNPSVLIPRPETEELVHWILNDYKQLQHIKLLDICTGSGCIAITLKKNRPGWDVMGVDISEAALQTALDNATYNETSVEFMKANVLSGTFAQQVENKAGKMDIIVSNPPYVMPEEMSQMHKNVLEYEPHMAVFVDDKDPLIFYKTIADFAKTALKPGGKLYFEINEAKGQEMIGMLLNKGLQNIELRQDLNNTDRMVKAELM